MNRHVLKDQFSQAIGNRKVLAALFYTFNFDPVFFENYVMPMLVPEKKFKNEQIYNTILWRRCAREGQIPAITVYCDHYAKDSTIAPTLGYDMRCIRLPAAQNVLVNFHPKESWILLDDGSLLQFNGSANLTHAGWCENLECVALTIFTKNQLLNTDSLNQNQRIIHAISDLSLYNKLSHAEEKIFEFLHYTGPTANFFSSIEHSFRDTLSELIIANDIHTIEIVSPYMYGEALLIDFLQRSRIEKIYCLIPSLKNDEVLLGKETFISMMNNGVIWCNWVNDEVNREPRNLHAKIYRLYGSSKTITITGSMNFTNPAWNKFQYNRSNQANVESGIIHVQELQPLLLAPRDVNLDEVLFIEKYDLSVTECTDVGGRGAPELIFTLNWNRKTLSFAGKIIKGDRITFSNILNHAELITTKGSYDLEEFDFKYLSKNSLIELEVNRFGSTHHYSYYPIQVDIQYRPLSFKMSPEVILKFWMLGDDEFMEDELTGGIAEYVTNESGEVDHTQFKQSSLLNEMAQHFTALVRLEKRLFKESPKNKEQQFQEIKYFLLSENLETIPFYLKGLKQMLIDATISNSFYWMILQIINSKFYQVALQWPRCKNTEKDKKSFKRSIRYKCAEILILAEQTQTNIPGLAEKSEWFIQQINKEYAN